MTRLLRLLAALFALSLVLAACGDDDGGDGGDTESADDGGDCSADICMSGSQFVPGEASVSSGDSVQWTNTDAIEHTVTADDGSFDSGNLSQDDSFDFTFAESGDFAFHCEIHPGMTGTITVE